MLRAMSAKGGKQTLDSYKDVTSGSWPPPKPPDGHETTGNRLLKPLERRTIELLGLRTAPHPVSNWEHRYE